MVSRPRAGQVVERPRQLPRAGEGTVRIGEVLPVLHVDHRVAPARARVGRGQEDVDVALVLELRRPHAGQDPTVDAAGTEPAINRAAARAAAPRRGSRAEIARRSRRAASRRAPAAARRRSARHDATCGCGRRSPHPGRPLVSGHSCRASDSTMPASQPAHGRRIVGPTLAGDLRRWPTRATG